MAPLDEPTPEQPSAPATHTRRHVLLAAGGLGLLGTAATFGGPNAFAGVAATGSRAAGASRLLTAARRDGAACVELTPEVSQGPFYLRGELVRRDIREAEPGFLFDLTLQIIDSTTCEPIPDAAVDVWQCNAVGTYSGVSREAEGEDPEDSDTFLRGIQLTDDQGRCRFTTIVPGWYPTRAVHIHTKVHVGGKVRQQHYQGGHISHIGQVFFSESLLNAIQGLDPYSGDPAQRVLNDDDQYYHQAGGRSAIISTKAIVKGDPTQGYTGRMILGIDPSAHNG